MKNNRKLYQFLSVVLSCALYVFCIEPVTVCAWDHDAAVQPLKGITSDSTAPSDFVPHDVIGKCTDLDITKSNLLAARRYECSAGDIIDFPVYLYNNTGYANAGIRFVYDTALTPLIYAGDNSVGGNSPLKAGIAGDSITSYGLVNTYEHNVSLGTSS